MALHYRTTLGMPYGPSPTREQAFIDQIDENPKEVETNIMEDDNEKSQEGSIEIVI